MTVFLEYFTHLTQLLITQGCLLQSEEKLGYLRQWLWSCSMNLTHQTFQHGFPSTKLIWTFLQIITIELLNAMNNSWLFWTNMPRIFRTSEKYLNILDCNCFNCLLNLSQIERIWILGESLLFQFSWIIILRFLWKWMKLRPSWESW